MPSKKSWEKKSPTNSGSLSLCEISSTFFCCWVFKVIFLHGTYPFWRMELHGTDHPHVRSSGDPRRWGTVRINLWVPWTWRTVRIHRKGVKKNLSYPIDKAILIHFRGVNYRHFYYITPTQTSRTTCLGMFFLKMTNMMCVVFIPPKKPGNSIIPDLIETLFPKSFESTGHRSPIWIYLDLYIELE